MIAVIRVRGTANITRKIRETLEIMRLFKSNHLVLLEDNTGSRKMVEKVKDYVTYGKVDEKTLAKILEKRGMLEGDKKIDREFLKKHKLAGFENLAKEIMKSRAKIKESGIKPVFRLNPPKKGYERKGVKKPFVLGGALGNRQEKINDLILRMC